MSEKELVAIAIIRRAVGLKGFCSVAPIGATFDSVETPKKVYVGKNEQDVRELTIDTVEERPNGFVCRFSGIEERTMVEQMHSSTIYLPKEKLPPLEEGNFYHFELEGLDICSDTSGELIGKVKSVINLPSMDALEVVLKKGDSALLPYTDQAICSVDMDNRRIIVRWSFVEELLG